jgi:hypothetical protein
MLTSLLVAAAAATCSIASPPHTVALVELYTSQGCSSCPPADRWLSSLPAKMPSERAVPLALHVGYWDYIGWKDPFAKREFNERQRWLAGLNRNRTVYTPGVFLDAHEWPDWHDARAFADGVSRRNLQPARASIGLAATAGEEGRLTVDVTSSLAPAVVAGEQELFLALKQHGHSTAVARGENRGETLHNDHVVRDWLGPLRLGTSRQQIALPADGPRRFELVAFVQDRRSGDVLQAISLPLNSCLR